MVQTVHPMRMMKTRLGAGTRSATRQFRRAVCAWLAMAAAGGASAQSQGDLNEDALLDAGDVASSAVAMGAVATTDTVAIGRLDYDRSGLLDAGDPLFLARVISGAHGFLPLMMLSEELTNVPVLVTNQSELTFDVFISDADGAFMVLLGDEVVASGTGAGQGSVTVDLEEGSNLFVLEFTDEGGNEIVRQVEIRRDTIAPAITIETPLDHELLTTRFVTVTGQALDGETPAYATVNGVTMTVNADGRYGGIVEFPLDVGGPRRLRAIAVDAAGNETEAARDFDLFVSAPEILEDVAARVDMPEGALCQRGEEPGLGAVTNAEIKSVLGPGSEMLLTAPPPGALTDGIIVLPSGMMVSVESGENPEAGLEGAEPLPMFAQRPDISLANETGADNSMHMYIFQVIPDQTGDGKPELSLAARAIVAESGPYAGRIVPLPVDPGDDFPGTFSTEVPVFENATLGQVRGFAAVRALEKRLEARRARGEPDPRARVTFFCCAASAVVPVRGQIKCDPANLDAVIERVNELQEELYQTGREMRASADKVSEAEDARISTISDIAGLYEVTLPDGTKVSVPTLVNGKAYGCLKNFVPASAILKRLDEGAEILNQIDDVKTLIGNNPRPPHETVLRGADLAGRLMDSRLRARADNASLAEWLQLRDRFIQLEKYKGIVEKAGAINDCGSLLYKMNQFLSSWITTSTEPVVTDALMQQYDTTQALYRRYADCFRRLIAADEGSVPGGMAPEWLRRGDIASINTRLETMLDFAGDALASEDTLSDFGGRFTSALQDPDLDSPAMLALLDELTVLVNEDMSLVQRQDELTEGFDALAEASVLAPTFAARVITTANMAEATTDELVRQRDGFGGAYVTFQGQNTPFGTMSSAGGGFVHYVFSTLTIDDGPPRIAILEDRPYAADVNALGGLLTGQGSGTSGRHEFPFTPFSTVDFDVLVDVGPILVSAAITDDGSSPPEVSITRPASGATAFAGKPLRVDVTSTDDFAVMGVELSVDGVSQLGLPGGTESGIVTLGSTIGTQTITAVAADAGGALGTATATVNAVDAAGAFTISPVTATIGQGESIQFSAMVLGNPAGNVIWKVNGFEGGQPEATGSISETGLYETSPITGGFPAAIQMYVSAALEDYPGFETQARVIILDSREVVAPAVAFSIPAPSFPGGQRTSPLIAISVPGPAFPGGRVTSRPVAFSAPGPALPGGIAVSRPVAFSFPSPEFPGGSVPSRPIAFQVPPVSRQISSLRTKGPTQGVTP
ncbi:Ig-like domain-containing protein [Candidatus Poribacteria bacterium]|nr:Ig-like domain-containing protein [Candidatus Poribacteria bacterium]